MKNLRLRTKLLATAVPPLAILAVLVAYALELTYAGGGVDAADMQQDLRVLGLVGLAGVLGSALLLILVTRSVTAPLDRLTRAADELSTSRLPALVEQLRNPAAEPPAPAELLELDSDDELGRLARALDGVQAMAVEVSAAQQRAVREGLSSLVVNLARRNQALLERQLSFIDQLETGEQDPDRLEELYRLDHLATRMRRNAESLLVLAGAEAPRRRGAPVQLVDVVRVAKGEIEDYRHVEVGGIHDVEVGAGAAVDLAHLLSELMENATQFSPPDAPVLVEGRHLPDGGYAVGVVDRGIGMADEQLAEANAVLSAPPELGLDLSRSLGFLVMGRLARRLGATVSLAASPERGVTATVAVPAALLSGATPVGGLDTDALATAAGPQAAAIPSFGTEPPAPAQPLIEVETLVEPRTVGPVAGPDPGTDVAGGAAHDHAIDGSRPDDDAWATGSSRPDDLGHGADGGGHGVGPRAAVPAAEPAGESRPRPLTAVRQRAAEPTSPPPSWWDRPPQRPAAELRRPVRGAAAVADATGDDARPQRLADALPQGAAFELGVSSLLSPDGAPAEAPVEPPVEPDRTEAGLVKRRRGEQAPAEQAGRPVTASSRSPEEIREMLARYRSGIKHRRPAGATQNEEAPR